MSTLPTERISVENVAEERVTRAREAWHYACGLDEAGMFETARRLRLLANDVLELSGLPCLYVTDVQATERLQPEPQ